MNQLLNKILLEDCFTFFNRLPDASLDLAIIDPPYNMQKGDWDKFSGEKDFFTFTQRWIDAFLPKMKADGSFYIFNTPLNSAVMLPMLLKQGTLFLNWITWYKKDGLGGSKKRYVNNQETILFFAMGGDYYFNAEEIRLPYLSRSRIAHAEHRGIIKNGKRWFPNKNGRLCADVWEFSSYRHNNKINGKTTKFLHPTPKPEAMIERMILASSRSDNLVLDLFSGSGTTAAMCIKHNRNFVGCEAVPEFHSHIEKRINPEQPGTTEQCG